MNDTSETYRVVLLKGSGNTEGWLTADGKLTQWMHGSGEWDWEAAKAMRSAAQMTYPVGLESCEWHVVPAYREDDSA